MLQNQHDRIRRAAILVASLDDALAESLLRALPESEVDQIYGQLERLGEVDPEEQRDVLDEFRRRSRRATLASEGVEFTASPAAAAAAGPVEGASAPAAAEQARANEPASPLRQADHLVLARLLSEEHPQAVAAALARLGPEQGAAVFAALPRDLQREALLRAANLQNVDDGVAHELESHLAQQVNDLQDRQLRMAASAELAQRLISQTSPALQEALLADLAAHDPAFMPPRSAAKVGHQQTDAGARRERRLAELADANAAAAALAQQEEFDEPEEIAATEFDARAEFLSLVVEDLEDCSREIEQLSDRALMAAIQQADEATVLRALAASSDRIVCRVARRLPRRHARQLRSMLRSLGPIRVSEFRHAQHQLLQFARTWEAPAAAA